LIWFQGGDGFFNEILNGFLSSRHKAPYPPSPTDIVHSVDGNGSFLIHHGSSGTVAETTSQNEEHSPLLSTPIQENGPGFSNFSMYHNNFISIQVKHGFDCLCNWWLPDLSLKIYLKLQELKMVLVTSVSLFHTLQLYTIFGITILKYNSSPLLADILFFINLVLPIFW